MTFPPNFLQGGRLSSRATTRNQRPSRHGEMQCRSQSSDTSNWLETLWQLATCRVYPQATADTASASTALLWLTIPSAVNSTADSRHPASSEARVQQAAAEKLEALVEHVICNGGLLSVPSFDRTTAAEATPSIENLREWRLRGTLPRRMLRALASLATCEPREATCLLLQQLQQCSEHVPLASVHVSGALVELVTALQQLIRFRLKFESCCQCLLQMHERACRAYAVSRARDENDPGTGTPGHCSTSSMPVVTEHLSASTQRFVETADSSDAARRSDRNAVAASGAALGLRIPLPWHVEAFGDAANDGESFWYEDVCDVYRGALGTTDACFHGSAVQRLPAGATSAANRTGYLGGIHATEFNARNPEQGILRRPLSKALPSSAVELCTPREAPGLDDERSSVASQISESVDQKDLAQQQQLTIPPTRSRTARAFFRTVLARYGEGFLMEQLSTGSGTGMVGSERHKLSRHAEAILIQHYECVSIYPSAAEREQLVNSTGLTRKQICWWFSNRRMREKRGRLGSKRYIQRAL